MESINITAQKIGFAVYLILIKGEAKYDQSFDLNFDAKRANVISNFNSRLWRTSKEEWNISMDSVAKHLIPDEGEVNHVNTFDSQVRVVQSPIKLTQG